MTKGTSRFSRASPFSAVRYYMSTLLVIACLGPVGCSRAMRDNSRLKPLESFENGPGAFTPVSGTVARGKLNTNENLFLGKSDGAFTKHFPVPVDRAVLQQGQQRYEIYCAPCHDSAGNGDGMIVQRGFKHPVPFSDERLRAAPVGYFFDAISHGYKTMYPMAAQISVEDRWAIVAYVRALQRSQHASMSDVPNAERKSLEAGK
jgi:mono/diheme cytochrome c family protein